MPFWPPRLPLLLQQPDFRRLWLVGLAGYFVRWLEILVFGVFTYQQTGSAFLVATMIMLRLLPLAVLGIPFGVVAARTRRRTSMQVAVSVLGTTAAVLFLISAFGALQVWHLAVASLINGAAWAGDNSLRRSLMGEIAGTARMGNAMALDIGASNLSRLLGPAIGGLMFAYLGIAAVFLMATVLYGLSLRTLANTQQGRTVPPEPAGGRSRLSESLLVGVRTARQTPRLAGALWITIVFNVFGWPVLSMVPVIGKDRLGLSPDGIGLLASMDGMGTLLGALLLAWVSRPALYGRFYIGGGMLFLAMIPFFALSTHVLLAALGLLCVGIGQSGFSVMQATLVFVASPPERRVHTMGLLTVCIGVGPIGFLMLGALAEAIGAPAAASASALAGLVTLALTFRWWRDCWADQGLPAGRG